MSELADLAVAILSQAQRRAEIAGQNLSNGVTPAYKRRVPFSALVGTGSTTETAKPQVNSVVDFRPGKLSQTGNPTDLAIPGSGYFALRKDDQVIYTRNGQLTLATDGRLLNAEGFALQLANGNDVVVTSARFTVEVDGTLTDLNKPVGRIAIYEPVSSDVLEPSGSGFRSSASALALSETATVRQGVIESSNVSTGDEMILLMESLRRAEAGQRVMNVYDDIMGRVITTFGENAR